MIRTVPPKGPWHTRPHALRITFPLWPQLLAQKFCKHPSVARFLFSVCPDCGKCITIPNGWFETEPEGVKRWKSGAETISEERIGKE